MCKGGEEMSSLLISINGVTNLKPPSTFEWGLQDVSDSDAGRDQAGLMYKNRITNKRKLTLGWAATTPEETAAILQAVQDEYFSVSYMDALTNSVQTRTFYCGDLKAPVHHWFDSSNNKYYTNVSFNLIER